MRSCSEGGLTSWKAWTIKGGDSLSLFCFVFVGDWVLLYIALASLKFAAYTRLASKLTDLLVSKCQVYRHALAYPSLVCII